MADREQLAKTVRIKLPAEMLPGSAEALRPGEEAAEPAQGLKPTPKAARLPREALSAKLGASGYALYQEFLESIYDAVLITDWQGHILDGNARASEFLRYEVQELCGLAIADIVYGLDEAVIQQIGGNLEHEQFTLIEEAYCRRKDQSLFPAEIATHKLHLGAEKHLCFFIRDITLRKQNEELLQQTRDRLVQAERLEMAGSIAGHIAHDFNNLLTPLVAYPDLIRGKLPEDSALHADLEVISKAAKQIAAINQQLLALALRGYQAQSVLNINSVIKLTVELLAYSAEAKRIKIDLALAEDLFNLKGSPEQLQRVIQNLCLNGIEAMDLGGTLTIKTENVYLDTPLKKHELVPPGEYIKVTIGDTGHGISRKNINQIFDPFFTTRPANQRRGAGLGLSVVRGIVKDHHGLIDLESAVGVGTVFNLYFPICRDEPEPAEPEKNYLGTETILVVDDDKLQIEVMTRLLQKAGYTVAGALSGEEALQLFNAYKPSARFPNLVILDMIMGDSMDGAQTYQELKAINPRQKAIILSGYAESPRVTLAQSLGAGAYVRKPVTLEKLGKAVRQELDRT